MDDISTSLKNDSIWSLFQEAANVSLIPPKSEKPMQPKVQVKPGGPDDIPAHVIAIVVLCCAVMLNYLVLGAVAKVSSDQLKAKYLLISNLLANLTYAFFSEIPVMVLIMSKIFASPREPFIKCIEFAHRLLKAYCLFYQGFCSMSLACDRLYAVTFPFSYTIKAYRRWVRCCVILCQLLLSAGCVAVALPGTLPTMSDRLCKELSNEFGEYMLPIRPAISMAQAVTTFIIYTVVFAFVYKQRLSVAKLSTRVTNKAASQSLTFLLVHLTSIICYLPISLYDVLVLVDLDRPPFGHYRMTLTLFGILLIFNSIIDPLILIWKIKSIRVVLQQNLRNVFNKVTRSGPQDNFELNRKTTTTSFN